MQASGVNSRGLRISVWWLLFFLWAAKMFWMSTGDFSGDLTRPLLARLLDLMRIDLSGAAFGVLHTVLRKSAHLFEYAVFGFLLYRSLGDQDRLSWQPHIARWCILAGAVYSLSDEFHQVFVGSRGASVFDCAIDTAGAALAMLVVYGVSRVMSVSCRQAGRPVPHCE
jgi:VanZ family protein